MLISIITPSYNSSSYIYQAYNSLISQSYKNWEWLITDDCSSDHTYDILKKIASKDERVKVFRNIENSGAAVSRNNSIKEASGDYIAFIDSDDCWLPLKLETQLKIMLAKKLDFSFTAFEMIDSDNNRLCKIVDSKQPCALTYNDMLRKKATLGCSTVMLCRLSFDDLSMPLIRTGQDYGLWLKLLRKGGTAYPINDVLTYYRILPNSISRNKVKKAKRQWEIYRDIEKLSLLQSIECFCFYTWRAIFRK